MLQAESIANQILYILKYKRNEPAHTLFFRKVGEVILDFSMDTSYLFIDFIDTDNRCRNQTDKIRLMHRLKRGVNNSDLSLILRIVLEVFLKNIKDDKTSSAASGLGKLTGKFVLNTTILNDLSAIFTSKFIGKISINILISTVFSIGGSVSRSVYGSEKLRTVSPTIYTRLRTAGDLDLFYCLVDSYAGPFIEALSIKNNNPSAWREILARVAEGLLEKKL